LLVEVRVQSLGMDRVNNHPVVILQEVGGNRVLPIWIGPSEASAIATHLAGIPVTRPFTHDLLVSVLGGLGGAVNKAVITRVFEGTYYAELIVRRNGETIAIDARPSDSIAVALRTDARIYADETLMEHRQIEIASSDEEFEAGGPEDPTEMDPEELKEHLRRLNPEDFGRFTP
jgi:bifunctional DNase/RNase